MRKFLQLILLIMPFWAFSQLTVEINPTPATCIGNGSINIKVENTQANAIFDFTIYRSPNLSTPFRSSTGIIANSNTLNHEENNLPAGSYIMKTYQNISGIVNIITTNFIIDDNYSPITKLS